jgi:hypothetical protein
MIRFWCVCGRQLQACDTQAGALAQCPVCQHVTVVPAPSPVVDDKQQSAPPARPAWWNTNLLSLQHAGNPFAFSHGVRRCHDADVALALGLFGLACFGLPSPVTVVFGIRALRQLRGCEDDRPGRWEAAVGLALGLVQLTGIFLVAQALFVPALWR